MADEKKNSWQLDLLDRTYDISYKVDKETLMVMLPNLSFKPIRYNYLMKYVHSWGKTNNIKRFLLLIPDNMSTHLNEVVKKFKSFGYSVSEIGGQNYFEGYSYQ